MKVLTELKNNIEQAEERMEAELRRRYPVNSRIVVMLNHRQEIPTNGTVVGHEAEGYVRVRIDSAKEGSRRPVRSIYFTDVVV